jgi:hypothetical protein
MVGFVTDVRDVRLELVLVGGVVEVVLARASDVLKGFFCDDGGGRERDEMDGFLRSCSVDETGRSCCWLAEALSTGNRDVGRGIPERTGIEDGVSMVGVDKAGTLRQLEQRAPYPKLPTGYAQ